MGESVWKEAHRRAKAETLDLVRLNTPGRALLTLGSPAVALAVAWEATGQIAYATVAAVGALLIFGLLIYSGKLVLAPAQIARDDRATLHALQAQIEAQPNTSEIAAQLVAYMKQAEEFMDRFHAKRPPNTSTLYEWGNAVRDYVTANLNAAHAYQFDRDVGLSPKKPMGYESQSREAHDYSWLDHRMTRLRGILETLR